MSPKQLKLSQTAPAPTVRNATRRWKLHSRSIYAEGLGQSLVGLVIVASVSVSPGEPWVVASMGFLRMEIVTLRTRLCHVNSVLKEIVTLKLFY